MGENGGRGGDGKDATEQRRVRRGFTHQLLHLVTHALQLVVCDLKLCAAGVGFSFGSCCSFFAGGTGDGHGRQLPVHRRQVRVRAFRHLLPPLPEVHDALHQRIFLSSFQRRCADDVHELVLQQLGVAMDGVQGVPDRRGQRERQRERHRDRDRDRMTE